MTANKRAEKTIVFIVGAGASATICPDRIPCMSDYFAKWVKQTEASRQTQYWLPLASVEEARVFPPNPDAEMWATRVRTIGWEIDSFKEKSLSTTALEETQQNYLESYIEVFKNDDGRMTANLERILSTIETMEGFDVDDARSRLIMSINTFFNDLDKDQDIDKKFSAGPHQRLAEFLRGREDLRVTFISFNYDLWLEKSLQQNGLWNPGGGYGHTFLYTRPHKAMTESGAFGHYEARSFGDPSPSPVSVLKPNGSLSWFHVSDKEPVLLTDSGEETGKISYNPDFYLDRVNIGNTVGRLLTPLIVPPIPTTNRRHPVFWSIDKNIQACIQEAHVLVIIGWSLPETDKKFAEDFRRAIHSRVSQLPSLVLCDISLREVGSGSGLIRKFETLFRPAHPAITRKSDEDGFSTKFVDLLETVL
ncbi:MAG: hypothetical protein V3T60_14185 [Candidatus Binatia bacterium]